MKIFKRIFLISSFTISLAGLAQAEEAPSVRLCGKQAQGEILQGKANGYQSIIVNGKKHKISPAGDFIIAFGRDQKKEVALILIDKDGGKKNSTLNIGKTQWDIQNIKGLPPRKVTPSPEDQQAIDSERSLVRGSLTGNLADTYWKKGFIRPVEGRISGWFGGQRIMNGHKMNPHGGTDIAAPEGTPVKAASDGVVTLNAPNTFYSGNVIVIDHGQGLQTIYAHLQKMNVKKGQKVKQGEVIGTVGKTGRVTGPHLHWGASLRGTRFNPFSLLNINKNNELCFNI